MTKCEISRTLGGGLRLRNATVDDIEALAQFNGEIHSDTPGEFEEGLAHWTRDLLAKDHPTVVPADFTLVEDTGAVQNDGRARIVSSVMLISQTWSYDGIEFGFGQPELVGTDPDYRRRGLIRAQMEAIHRRSEARGHLVQGITGIPWYYRQFGYEMTLDLGGGRNFFWQRHENRATAKDPSLSIRIATPNDIPFMQSCFAQLGEEGPICCLRSPDEWRYAMQGHHPKSVQFRNFRIVEDSSGQPFGYFRWSRWGQVLSIQELAVEERASWRDVAMAAAENLRQEAAQTAGEEKEVDSLRFHLGAAHPAYDALGNRLEKQEAPYKWYIRVPDLRSFLHHITPALEQRLQGGVVAGYSGELKLNFYTSQLKMIFESGAIKAIAPYEPGQFDDADGFYPELTFYHLLFGHRTTDEIRSIRPDCWIKSTDAAAVLNSLFPRQASYIYMWD